MKKSVSYFLILNLFLSVIAFSFILNINLVDALDPEDKPTEDKAKTPPVATIVGLGASAQGLTGIANKIKITPTASPSSAGYIYSHEGKDYWIKSKPDVSEGAKTITGINPKTGENFNIEIPKGTDIGTLKAATDLEGLSAKQGLIEIGSSKYTLTQALKDPSLVQQLEKNPSLLGKDVTSFSMKDGEAVINYKDSVTTINVAKGVASSTEKIGGSSYLSETLGLRGGTYTDAIVSGAQWAAVVGVGSYMIADFLGADEGQSKAIGVALGAGTFAGKSLNTLFSKGGKWSGWFGDKTLGMTPGQFSFVAGAATAAIIFLAMYKSEETKTISFTCDLWQPPVGGSNCEKCNKQGSLPCSEYQCKSLGQSCKLLNPGTDEESCTWVNRKDVNPPVIKPLTSALLNNYVYAPDATISPPDKGVKVQNTALASKCAEAFTPLTFGVITNEPAQCKISPLRERTFDDMTLYFGGSNTLKYNHTHIMKLPGADELNASGLVVQNGGNYELYVRCQDANKNSNIANFVFKYCVEQGPDTTPPLIVTTNLLNGMPIAYNQNSIDIEVYTDKPADCKWDHLDTNYDSMNNAMTCSSSVLEMNTQMLYKCSSTLTGLKNEFENKFYFRCKSYPLRPEEDRYANAQSHKFTLIGTRPLVIDSVSPNNTVISDATDIIQVNLNVLTSAGYKDGESACYWSETGTDDSYVMFFNTNSYNHSQELWLAAATYTYHIKCLDLGGNTDQKTISFTVQSDVTSPLVVRVYHEGTYLKLVTNENAECVYDTTSCSYTFEDGIKMSVIGDVNHFTDWDTQTNFYIKCKDSYGNKPLPDKCNIIAKPSQIF